MKAIINLSLAVTLLVTASCNYIANYNKPYLEVSGDNPYELKITGFSWGYSVTEIGKFNGDFETLNRKVYEALKGKYGVCKVFLEKTTTDKYGKKSSSFDNIGTIDLSELNKFENYEYWQEDAGIKKLIIHFYQIPVTYNLDEGKRDTTTSKAPFADTIRRVTQVIDTVKKHKPRIPKTYSFPEDKLYPVEEDRSMLSENQSTVNGIITQINFNVCRS